MRQTPAAPRSERASPHERAPLNVVPRPVKVTRVLALEEEFEVPELHQKGVDLVLELLDVADHPGSLPDLETRNLLKRAATTLSELLVRDKPAATRMPERGKP